MRTSKNAALPPLQPAPAPKPELKKITNLVNKALTSTSLKEKNDLLQEMRVIWIPQNEELEAITASNNEKQRELDSYTQRRDQTEKDCETLKVNTSFYYKAQTVRDRKNEAALSRLIQNTEAEISKISTLSSPNKLNQVNELSSNPDKHLFTLTDLNLSRLEELAYAYKKRLLIVEQSQESTDLIVKEFGSVYGLLDKEKELAEENERLKNDEKAFIHDAFTRRRKFAEMSPNVARTMTTVFTTEIQNQNYTLETYQNCNFEIPHDNNNEIDFDAVCHDSGFATEPNHFEEAEFTANDETTDKLLQATDPRDRLRVFKELIEQLENNNNRLMTEINQCRQKKRRYVETSTSRFEKLVEENDSLFQRIAREQDLVDSRSEESERIAKDLMTLIKHRSGYSQHYVDTFAQYRDLSKAHAELTREIYRDKAVLSTILHITCTTGDDLMRFADGNRDPSPVSELLSSQIKDEAKAIEDSVPPPPVQPVEVPKEEPPEEISIMSIAKGGFRKQRRKVHRDNSKTHMPTDSITAQTSAAEKQTISQTSSVQMSVQQTQQSAEPVKEKPLRKPTGAELYNAVSLALDLGGFVIGNDKRYHAAAHFELMRILDKFFKGTKENLDEFQKYFHENFMKIRFSSNQILVKQKENIAIQTEAAPRMDEDTQTSEGQNLKTSRKK